MYNITYLNNDNFLNHIIIIQNKQACANTLNTTISNVSFKTIILNFLLSL